MRGHDNIRHGYQSCQSVIVDDMTGPVMEEDIALLLIYIEAGSSNLPVLDSGNQGVRIDESAS